MNESNENEKDILSEQVPAENSAPAEVAEESDFVKGESTVSEEQAVSSEEGESTEEKKKPFSDGYEWLSSLVYAVVAMLVLNLFAFRSITVDGPSMNDTLQDQDKVIATNFLYTPDYGDIVIVQADKLVNRQTMRYGEPIIKRVIGLEGDVMRFDFATGEVYRNGELLDEPYIKDLTRLPLDGTVSGVDYVVPEHCVYIMGDNRMNSRDSRDQVSVGYIDTDLILGKAILRVYPFESFGVL